MIDCQTCIHYKKNCKADNAEQTKRKKLNKKSFDCYESFDLKKLNSLNNKANDLMFKIDKIIKS